MDQHQLFLAVFFLELLQLVDELLPGNGSLGCTGGLVSARGEFQIMIWFVALWGSAVIA